MQQQQKARRYVPFWLMAATTVVLVLAGLQLLAGFQQTEASPTGGRSLPARKLADDSPPSKRALRTTHTCIEARGGLPEQRVCVFHDLVLYNGRVLYVTDDANDTVPPIKISWLKKFEGDNMFQHTVVNQSQLEFNWDTAQVEEIPQAGLIHQQHYSNFYHMFSEVAPSVHFVLCKFLGDCTYSADSKTRLFFIQEKRPDIPVYIMLDSIADTFACMSPQPVWHKDDPQMQNRVYVLKKAVVGVSNEVRAFHNWEQDFQKQYREPPKAPMVAWRQRMADCFGFNFTQAVAPTNTLRILFINRHYEEGRMILNQAKLAHLIEKLPEVKEFQGLEIDLQYLNGDDTLRHQAALFWNASLLIWPHGATMAMTTFLPRGAQAVEVIPWVEEDKARHPEWVQAIRDTFSLSIDLYAVQNKERRRVMFNQDALAEYPQYRDASPEHKIALLEQGVCPPGVDGFTCPFWWNHWKVSLNLDWAVLEPTLKTALGKLIELRKAGGQLPVAAAADSAGGAAGSGKDGMLQEGAGAADAEPAGDGHDRSRSLAGSPSQQAQQRGAAAAAAGLEPAAAALLAAEGGVSQAGVPLSALSCLHDDGKAEHRLCVASNLVAYMGKLYYVTEDPAGASLPEIQISWEDWEHEKDLREDKYFAPKLVRPSELPFTWDPAQADTIDRAWLPHIVDSGNFYHILSEVLPTFFANWCKFVGVCHYQDRQGFEVLFIQPDPKRRFGLIRPLEQAWQCFSQKPPRKLIDIGSTPVLIKHGVLGIGPYMRAYEQQGFRKAWEDPPAGLMPKWLQFLSACTGTGFAAAQAPNDVLRITFVNRPWSAGRSFLNLHEVVVWLTREWLPARKLPRPFEVETATVHEWQNIEEQIAVFQRTSILVYPHGATMTHAIFLPKGSVALEVIPWPKVTEPHGWLQSIKRQYELEGLQLGLLVNKYRANLVLNWQALAWDPVWKTLTAEEKVALQEEGTCPKAHEPKCFFDWLHWKSELVLDKEQLAEKLTEALGMLGLGGTAATA